jgi:transcription-repair coupling factor (superfamily II helicase)
VLWRLRSTPPDRCPAIVVAGVRALLQQLGPDATTIEPMVVTKGDVLDPDELLARLIHFGYRREELVEHRGEVAQRGAIIDIFPSTADAPIRIDLWGDEVDRLTEFAVNDQRSVRRPRRGRGLPGRELIPTDEVARPRRRARGRPSRGAASSGSAWPRARCSTAWRAGCRGWSTASN